MKTNNSKCFFLSWFDYNIGRSLRCLLFVVLRVVVLLSLRCDVERWIDDFGNRFDLSAELLLDAMEIVAILVGDEIDGNTWNDTEII